MPARPDCGRIVAARTYFCRYSDAAGQCLVTLVMSEHILWTGAAVCFVIALAIIAFTV